MWGTNPLPRSLITKHLSIITEGSIVLVPFLDFLFIYAEIKPNPLVLSSSEGGLSLASIFTLVQHEFPRLSREKVVLVRAKLLALSTLEREDNLVLVQQADFGKLSSTRKLPPAAFCSYCGEYVEFVSTDKRRSDRGSARLLLVRKYGLCRACYKQLQRAFREEMVERMTAYRRRKAIKDQEKKKLAIKQLQARHVPQQLYDATDVLLLYQGQRGKCPICSKYLLDVLWDGVQMQYKDSNDKTAGTQLLCGTCANTLL